MFRRFAVFESPPCSVQSQYMAALRRRAYRPFGRLQWAEQRLRRHRHELPACDTRPRFNLEIAEVKTQWVAEYRLGLVRF